MPYEIVLQPMDQPPDGEGICVGVADRWPLVFHERVAYVHGRRAVQVEILDALYPEIDRICTGLWGPEWPAPLAVACGLSRRSTSRDRVRRKLLPAPVLRWLAEHQGDRIVGDLLLATARWRYEVRAGWTPSHELADVLGYAGKALDRLAEYRAAARMPEEEESES